MTFVVRVDVVSGSQSKTLGWENGGKREEPHVQIAAGAANFGLSALAARGKRELQFCNSPCQRGGGLSRGSGGAET